MNRLICSVNHENGPMVDYSEDRIEIYLDPYPEKPHFYCWIFNAAGYCKEMKLLRQTGQPQGRWQIGNELRVKSKASRNDDSWTLQCVIPFTKLSLGSLEKNSVLLQIRRARNLYATEEIPALECKTSDTFYWPKDTQTWCRLSIEQNPE